MKLSAQSSRIHIILKQFLQTLLWRKQMNVCHSFKTLRLWLFRLSRSTNSRAKISSMSVDEIGTPAILCYDIFLYIHLILTFTLVHPTEWGNWATTSTASKLIKSQLTYVWWCGSEINITIKLTTKHVFLINIELNWELLGLGPQLRPVAIPEEFGFILIWIIYENAQCVHRKKGY